MIEKMSRRTFLKKVTACLLGSIVIGFWGYVYARYIEPNRLAISALSFESEAVPLRFNGIKIVQFSDTHIGYHYSKRQLKKHVQIIQSYKPDLIVFTGDLIDKPNQYSRIHDLPSLLAPLSAPLGKYAVYGNHDHGGYGTDLYAELMQKAGFSLLRNEFVKIKKGNDDILLSGIDEPMLGRPDFTSIFNMIEDDPFHIFLSHAPDLADLAGKFDLQLSGHSHGGQIQIPFFGALIVPPYAENYIEGRYDLIEGDRPTSIYVNRGLGTTRMPFRLLSTPEISIITLKRKT
ncbi:metallophosphoesterase [Jeotgalibacillus soli]|uniref:Calcineurin-like phosphoesterase domain-containing protein n=1 Tax=Jeotgalibacillus soli TaxID=889306 RepID=A0A0C2V6W0_9BACL|nr:metallophosphoesterase [Jeotgalibacillus soli]KIL44702.1 hypothetical protein KP78_22460 [Jeotgalibacillus soli]